MQRNHRRKSTISLPYRLAAASVFASTFFAGAALAQVENPTSVPAPRDAAVVTQNGDVFFYKVNVVRRDIDCINYLHRSGSTEIRFVGTDLLPGGQGHATVKSERGGITIDADFKGLTPANGFGPGFLTYVLWAISPDGRPNNLGEVLPAGTKNNIHVTTALQSFGLIVTAEPYFSVSTPSDLIVLKNIPTGDTNGVLEQVTAHATLFPHGMYTAETDGAHTVANPITRNEHSPLELYEAYNALRFAQITGAEKYSSTIYAEASQDLKNAADFDANKHRSGSDEKMEITYAREAVERAEDARVDTLRKQSAERQRDAEIAKNTAQQQAAQSQVQAQESQLQAQQALLAKQQADAARAEAEAQAAEAKAQAAAANQQAQSAEQSAQQVREKLRQQLNSVLATSESARGLIVNMSDVLFDTGKYSLKTGTQISLAKVAGILEAYPGLKVQVEGYTDAVGSDPLNETLSENRADSVMHFLVSQGVPQTAITAQGFGKADPVADNGTAAGRAQNRRVNLVVTGNAIGIDQKPEPNAGTQ
jgi:outer membrane protein OmpA-like peptidoglycan-associated protein